MAKDKERSINPAQQQRKLDKAKALKKGKAEVQSRRNEKLARRNPDRLQRQVDDLKALEESGQIKPREKQVLEQLERDVRAIRKARDALGEQAPQFGSRGAAAGGQGQGQVQGRRDGSDGSVLGKRKWSGERSSHHQRNNQHQESSGSETDESAKNIPLPRDTPPPIPHQHDHNHRHQQQQQQRDRHVTNANTEPLGEGRGSIGGRGPRQPHELPPKPTTTAAVETKTTYESAPQIRDLKKEAVGRFVPNIVRRKQDTVKGVAGGLVEPEDLDRLEREGYAIKTSSSTPVPTTTTTNGSSKQEAPTMIQHSPSPSLFDTSVNAAPAPAPAAADAEAGAEAEAEAKKLAAEEEQFRRELRNVEIEDVEDEDL